MSEPTHDERDDLRKAAIDAIALLDVAISGTVFTKPSNGRVVVNVAKAQAVLDALRSALFAPVEPQRGDRVSAPEATDDMIEAAARAYAMDACEKALMAGTLTYSGSYRTALENTVEEVWGKYTGEAGKIVQAALSASPSVPASPPSSQVGGE